uniref:MOSC domain-containing protein n=1 Tax=Panagrellus redivivus TaxID=6233 RepID=A0A7E4WBH3_PANRE
MRRIYLDHAGATLPSTTQMASIADSLASDVFRLGNPHSRHTSGQTTAAVIANARARTLSLLGATVNEYAVIFTNNTTDSLRILAESLEPHILKHSNEFTLFLHKQSHTSLQGIRSRIKAAKTVIIDQNDVSTISTSKHGLYLCTAMSNYCGKKVSPEDIKKTKQKCPNLLVCLDLAALVGTSEVNLQDYSNLDFAVLSFYKIFGYPTGLGALVIRKDVIERLELRPIGFAGGSVDGYVPETGEYRLKSDFEERFNMGTPNYQTINALRYGFDDIAGYGGMKAIQTHTFNIAKAAFTYLSKTTHANGAPIAVVYGWEKPSSTNQGPIVNFNLLRDDGSYVGYVEVEKMCDLFNIELRTGCFCNQGACNAYLNLSNNADSNQLIEKKCSDETDLIDGKPVGSVRISFGRTSTVEDLDGFKAMIETCFLTAPTAWKSPFTAKVIEALKYIGRLTDIFVYPVKSASALRTKRWKLTKSGLWLDRQWIIVTADGVVLTQKRAPALCGIGIQVKPETLILTDRYGHIEPLQLPIDHAHDQGNSISTKVCINDFSAISCGPKASAWLNQFEPATFPTGTQILRMTSDEAPNCDPSTAAQAQNFNNQADYLLITWASIREIANRVGLSAEVVRDRFRANFVIETGSNIPFEEDSFTGISINGIEFIVTDKCTRCQMVAIDQETGQKDPGVLLALRDARCGDKVTFGVYLRRVLKSDNNVDVEIHVGATVKIHKD